MKIREAEELQATKEILWGWTQTIAGKQHQVQTWAQEERRSRLQSTDQDMKYETTIQSSGYGMDL